VRGVQVGAATTAHDVLERAAVADSHGIALVVVHVAGQHRDEVVRGIAGDRVDGPATLDRAGPVRPVGVERGAGHEHLGHVALPSSAAEPVALRAIDHAEDAGVDADHAQRPGVQRPVRRGLVDLLLRRAAMRSHALEIVGCRPAARVGVLDAAQVEQEPAAPVVPVVVSRHGEDRPRQVGVRAIELLLVLGGASRGVDDVAGDDEQVGARGLRATLI
jgi:hypothetical protein